MSDTPISDSTPHNVAELGVLCRKLERELGATKERIRLLIAERDTARLQASQNWKIREEFRALLGTDDVSTALAVVREMKDRIKRLEDAGDEAIYPLEYAARVRIWTAAKEAKP